MTGWFVLWTEAFMAEEKAIEPQSHLLHRALSSVYEEIKAAPYAGFVVYGNVYAWNTSAFMGLLPITLYYRVLREEWVIEMISIKVG